MKKSEILEIDDVVQFSPFCRDKFLRLNFGLVRDIHPNTVSVIVFTPGDNFNSVVIAAGYSDIERIGKAFFKMENLEF